MGREPIYLFSSMDDDICTLFEHHQGAVDIIVVRRQQEGGQLASSTREGNEYLLTILMLHGSL